MDRRDLLDLCIDLQLFAGNLARTDDGRPKGPCGPCREEQSSHMPSDQVTNRGESAPTKSQLDTFLEEVKQLASGGSGGGRGRIIFALDATASREQTWDTACQLQADMFREVAAAGGLEVQLVFYRGDR